MTEKTLSAVRRRTRQGTLSDIRHFFSGDSISLAHLTVETLPTPHDGVDGVGFVIDDGERRLGILTDLGHVFDGLSDLLQTLDAVVIESNYDPKMLEQGWYPERLKQRIRGPGGHLSNQESAELLSGLGAGRLQWACLAHLSEKNNGRSFDDLCRQSPSSKRLHGSLKNAQPPDVTWKLFAGVRHAKRSCLHQVLPVAFN